MWYACRGCGHRERIWNSRDGVTPFGLGCPSCGDDDLLHVEWARDVYAPGHALHHGQRFFRDGTVEEAVAIMSRRIARAEGTEYACTPEQAAELLEAARHPVARGEIGEFNIGWPMVDRWQAGDT
jgi:hypothetical protein